MDPRSRTVGTSGQFQGFYDHSTPYGRFNSWLNRLPWNWILITLTIGFLVFIIFISVEPSIEDTDAMMFADAMDTKEANDYGNTFILNNGTEYVFEGDGIHSVKFPGFNATQNLSSIQTIQLQNVQIDLAELINQLQQIGLKDLDSVSMENVTLSGALVNQAVPKVKISFL